MVLQICDRPQNLLEIHTSYQLLTSLPPLHISLKANTIYLGLAARGLSCNKVKELRGCLGEQVHGTPVGHGDLSNRCRPYVECKSDLACPFENMLPVKLLDFV